MNLVPSFQLAGCAAAGALLIGFGAGWYVESLRWDASLLRTVQAAQKVQKRQQGTVATQATIYETERTHEAAQHESRQQQIRTVYQDRIVPGECAVPDAGRRVLEQALERAAARARGEPGDELPTAPAAPDAADRPRPPRLGRDDDNDLWRVRLEALPDRASLAETVTAELPPDPAFALQQPGDLNP